MAIIVGSVAVDVVPSIDNFTRDAERRLIPEADRLGAKLGQHIGTNLRRALDTELKRIPNVNIDADTSRLKTKVAGARRELQGLGRETSKPQILPELSQRKLDEIKIQLSDVAGRAYSVTFDANDKQLVAKMAKIKLEADRLNRETARINLDDRGVLKIETDLAKLDAELDAFGRKRATATVAIKGQKNSEQGIRRIVDLLIGLSPAIAQIGVIGGGVIAGLGASVAVAGAGIGVVGIAAHGVAKLMKADLKQLKVDNGKLATAQAAVDNAKGPAARTAALKRLAAAQATVNELTKAMGPAETKLLNATNAIDASWKKWLRGTAIPGLQPIVSTFKGELPSLLRDITPLFNSAAKGINGFAKDLFAAFRSPFWQQFFGFLGKTAGPQIRTFGRILINSLTGLAGLIKALDPLGQHYAGTLLHLSQRFANFGTGAGSSKGFQAFLKFVRDNSPELGRFFNSLISFIVTFAKASAGLGVAELKAITGILTTMSRFAAQNPKLAAAAVAVFTLTKAVKALKLVALGGWIANLAKLAGLSFGSLIGAGSGAAAASGAGAAGAAGVAGLSVASIISVAGPIALAIAPLVALIVAKHVIPDSRDNPRSPNHPGVPDKALPNKGDTGSTTVDPRSGTVALENYQRSQTASAKETAANTRKIKENTGKGTGTHIPQHPGDSTLFNASQKIPLKVLISGDAVAAQKLLAVQKAVGGIPKNKDIRIGTPTVATVQGALANVIRATHGLPPLKQIKVSAPGGNLTALSMLNISRLARGLPPTKTIKLNTPGITGALEDINSLAHRMGLLPKGKSIVTSVPGARKSILDMINLDQRAHGLPPFKRIPTSAPGSDKAVQTYIALARRAGLIPPLVRIKTSTPGAVKAYSDLNTLLHNAKVLPKDKKIPTDVPGATASILHYINLKRRADGLPPLKKIPTSAPGADHSIQQAITLARKIGLIPPKHDTQINTPGADQAKRNISELQHQLATFPAHFATTIEATGQVHFGGTLTQANASGGPIDGPGGPRSDSILSRLSNGEWVHNAAARSFYGDDAMQAINQRKAIVLPKFANGGGVGSIFDIHEKTTGLDKIKGKIYNHDAMAAVAAVKQLFAGGFGGGGSSDLASWYPVVAQALAMLGQPTSLAPLWVNNIIRNESNGNPRAINLYDRNARAGTPSVGGNQVIGPTFRAYAGPFGNLGPFLAGVSVNKLANSYAALNYAIHAYGSIANTPGIQSLLHGGGYRPYYLGGDAKANVPIRVGEHGPEVFTPYSAGYVTPNDQLGGAGVHVDVWIGNEKITDIARVEVRREHQKQGQALTAGRRVVR